MTPLVSIVIPCHNGGHWLAATLKAAVAQTWPSTEVIVVDDQSTDESVAIARRYQTCGVRVLVQPERRGAAAARNAGLASAAGEYIQYLDADDLIAPDKIARQVKVLAEQPGALANGPWGHFRDAPQNARFEPERVWFDFAPVDWLVNSWSGGGMMPPIAWLVPREVAVAAGPWNEALTLDDDGEYFTRVVLASTGIRFVPEAKSYYRVHDGPRLSASGGRRAARSSFESIRSKERRLLAREDSPRTRRAVAFLWQRYVWEQLAAAPDLVGTAEDRWRQLDPGVPRTTGSATFERLASLVGWRTARRCQLWFGAIRRRSALGRSRPQPV